MLQSKSQKAQEKSEEKKRAYLLYFHFSFLQPQTLQFLSNRLRLPGAKLFALHLYTAKYNSVLNFQMLLKYTWHNKSPNSALYSLPLEAGESCDDCTAASQPVSIADQILFRQWHCHCTAPAEKQSCEKNHVQVTLLTFGSTQVKASVQEDDVLLLVSSFPSPCHFVPQI